VNLSILSPEEVFILMELRKETSIPPEIAHLEDVIQEKQTILIERSREIGRIDISLVDEIVSLRRELDILLLTWVENHVENTSI